VLQAPPGAGKTTRVPLALYTADWIGGKKVLMLEPRRLAARATARFMAHTLNEKVGETVGYRTRLDSRVGPRTRIEVVTEGILTRMLQDDPALEDVGVVIFDEFHERSLQADLGLALCLESQESLREDLRLLVMSATLDGAAIARLLNDAPILTSEGRTYPVEIVHRPPRARLARERQAYFDEVTHVVTDALREDTGSILVFLPGIGEIREIHKRLRARDPGADVLLAPLYGQLDAAAQDAAIQVPPAGKRKVVLATSIAQTSLTIEGIRVVIDAGLTRLPQFDPNTGLTGLSTQMVSQAAADQRCGRAGRLEAGICYRLWPEHQHLLAQAPPEILETDLCSLVLELAHWGVRDVTRLRWLDVPPPAHVAQATEVLRKLGAIDTAGAISGHGRAILQLGTHPRLAHMMIRGKAFGYGMLACELAALLSERDILTNTHIRDSDIALRVEALRASPRVPEANAGLVRQIRDTARQWQQRLACTPAGIPGTDIGMAGVLLAYAYPDRVAQRRSSGERRYLLSNGRGAVFREYEPLAAEDYIVTASLDGAREARIFLAAGISEEQLREYHASLLSEHTFVEWDEGEQRVQARRQLRLGEIVMDDRPWQDADPEAVQTALLEGIRRQGIRCLPWSDSARRLQARIRFLHALEPQGWPDVDDNALSASVDAWLPPYLGRMSRLADLQKLDLQAILLAQLSWQQQKLLEELAPTHITVPSGSRIRIDYNHDTPVLAVRLQEMFGLEDTPRIAGGRVPLLLHLLSPAQRPVQITRDLATFWRSSYHEVKKDMKGRYPKHAWPDDPMNAPPTARAKRR